MSSHDIDDCHEAVLVHLMRVEEGVDEVHHVAVEVDVVVDLRRDDQTSVRRIFVSIFVWKDERSEGREPNPGLFQPDNQLPHWDFTN